MPHSVRGTNGTFTWSVCTPPSITMSDNGPVPRRLARIASYVSFIGGYPMPWVSWPRKIENTPGPTSVGDPS
jgi:hypothetical protein